MNSCNNKKNKGKKEDKKRQKRQKELDLRVRESNPGLPRTASSRNALMTGGYTDHYTNADRCFSPHILRIYASLHLEDSLQDQIFF